MIPVPEHQGLLRAIMQAFEVLNRYHWSAPWDAVQSGPSRPD
ncbi:MAG: hypothetical protein ABW169_06800 [Sphingobium sp.]